MSTADFLAQPGDSTDLSVRLLENQPQITVNVNGGLFFMSTGHPGAHTPLVGTIGGLADPSVDTWSDGNNSGYDDGGDIQGKPS